MKRKPWLIIFITVAVIALAVTVAGRVGIQSRPATAPPLIWVTTAAGQDAWQALGPGGGGHFDVFAFGPDTIFVGTDTGGVFRSPDHGQTWLPANRGLYDYPVNDLAVDPLNPATVYAATHGGLYKSENNADTWRLLQNGFPPKDPQRYSAPLACVALDPSNPQIVYVGVGRPAKRTASEGAGDVYKSVNGGASWTRANIGHPQAVIFDLAVDPANAHIIYAATSAGFYRSADGGASWAQVDALDSRGLAVGHAERTVLYRTVWESGVWKSVDSGLTWIKLAGPDCPDCDYYRIATRSTDPDQVYVGDFGSNARDGAGIYYTADGGDSWRKLDRFGDTGWRTAAPLARGLGLNPFDPQEVFIGAPMAMYRSIDQGKWQQVVARRTDRAGGVNTRWSGRWVSRMGSNNTVVNTRPVFHPSQHDTYLLGYSDLYIWRTDDDGRSWENIQTPGENDVRSLAADPADPSFRTWFAGDSPQDCCGGSLYKTIDAGQNWSQATGLPDNRVWGIAVSPRDSNRVYVATQDYGVYRSANGGASFEAWNGSPAAPLPLTRLYGIVMHSTDPDILYVPVSGERGGLFRSTDGGENWHRMGEMQDCTAVEMSGIDGAIYAGCGDRVFKSADRGASWALFYPGGAHPAHPGETWPGYVADIAPHPVDPSVVCFVIKDDTYHDQSSGRGLWCTTDAGASWDEMAEDMGLALRGTRVAFHPLPAPETGAHDLFYMTGGGGAYRIRLATSRP